MSVEDINDIKKKYLNMYNKNEKKFSRNLTSSEYLALEGEQMKIDSLLEDLDDLLDAYNDSDMDYAEPLENDIMGRIR